jgi:mono/diheme cytochrome c family protein
MSLLIVCLSAGCYYDNAADLYGEAECSEGESTYSASVAPILNKNCMSCHSQAVAEGGVILQTYSEVKQQAESGKLLGTITHAGGFSPMPKDAPQLPECDLNAIRAWIDAGAANN